MWSFVDSSPFKETAHVLVLEKFTPLSNQNNYNENTDLTFYNIPGYSLILNTCRLSTHCGVAIYLHEKFSYERKFVDIFSTVFENLTIEICRNDSIPDKYLISTVYRPPKPLIEDLMTFIGEFSSFLRDVHSRYNKAYICGDMNINLF